jgi:hypothetical protein
VDEPPATLPAVSTANPWPLLARLPAQLSAAHGSVAWRGLLGVAHAELRARFLADEPVE